MREGVFCHAARCAAGNAAFAVVAAVLLSAGVAQARAIDGIRIGVLAHDVVEAGRAETGTDINGEIQFRPLIFFRSNDRAPWVNALLSPRPVIGASINVSGYTSQLYAGATWRSALWRDVFATADRIYGEFSLGGLVHNGNLRPTNPRREALGSRVLFHLSGELGYMVSARTSIGAYYERDSNGGMAKYNRSLNNVGVRLGYRF